MREELNFSLFVIETCSRVSLLCQPCHYQRWLLYGGVVRNTRQATARTRENNVIVLKIQTLHTWSVRARY